MARHSYEKILTKKGERRYPGIFRMVVDGQPKGFIVFYRVRGVGQKSKSFPRLQDAVEFQGTTRTRQWQGEARRRAKSRIAVSEHFWKWLERNRGITESTRRRYEGIGRMYICSGWLGRMLIWDVTRDDIEEWVTELVVQDVGSPTIDKAYRTFRAALTVAERDGLIPSNPARGISLPELVHRDPFFLTAQQVEALASAVEGRNKALVYFLAYTGVRMGEASALRVHHLDLVRRRVMISENAPEVAGKRVPGRPKSKKVRVVDLSEDLVAELSAHLDVFAARSRRGEVDPAGFVFSGPRGGQLRQGNWRSRVFQPAARSIGLVRVNAAGKLEAPRPHDLRHTAASLAAAAGYTLHEVKELLGHSTIQITSDLYLHLFEDAKKEKAQQLGEVMRGARLESALVIPMTREAGHRPPPR